MLVVGAGFAGLGLARQLKRAGIDDVVVLERGSRLGGTWRDNIYPGVACDVPTPLYSYSFALQPFRSRATPHGWSGLYAPHDELQAYLERCADTFDVRRHLQLGVDVRSASWDGLTARWRVETEQAAEGGQRGAVARCYAPRVLVSASGHALRVPITPRFPGAERFRGVQVHSARWDPTLDLRGRRVVVVGTGASAAQLVPAIADRVGHLTVFQRTAGWVIPKFQLRDAEQLESVDRVPGGHRALRWSLYWLMELIAAGHVFEPRLHEWFTEPRALRHLDAQVADPALREKLRPRFRLGCKRMIISNDFYPALTRPNVSLVTEPILAFDESGVLTEDGQHHAADVVIYATGYEAAEAPLPFEIEAHGRRLEDAWRDGSEAHRGTAVTGFPNLFFMVGPNTGQGHTSMVFMMESQYPYVAAGVRQMLDSLRGLEVRPEAQDAWNRFLEQRLSRTVWNSGGCKSWYLSRSGRNTTAWPGFTFEYWLRLRRFDRENFRAV